MSRQTEIYSFFPSLVQVSHIEGADELNKTLMNGVEKVREIEPNTMPESWACTVYTTINSPTILLEYDEFKPLGDIILREANAFARAMNFDLKRQPLKLDQCWLNVYGTSDSQEAHVHSNHVISGIYYIQAPEGCGELLLHSRHADNMYNPKFTAMNELNMTTAAIQPEAGVMLLFRSYLRHSVKPSQCKEDRISVAFNLKV